MHHDREKRLLYFDVPEQQLLYDQPSPVADTEAGRLHKLASFAARSYAAQLGRLYEPDPFDSAHRQMDISSLRAGSELADALALQLAAARDFAVASVPVLISK